MEAVMEAVFLKVLNMSVTATWAILAVCLLRLALKKAPRVLSYGLWAVVLFRLVSPLSFSAGFSLLGILGAPVASNGSPSYIGPDIGYAASPQVDVVLGPVNDAINRALPAAAPDASANPLQIWILLGSLLWLAGIGAMLAYGGLSTLGLKRRVADATLLEPGVYETDAIDSPFLLGLGRPRIYLPVGLGEEEAGYVLRHERAHIRRRDYLVKPLAFLALCLHWFNPAAWLAYSLMSADMEASCDEAVIRDCSREQRAAYGATLLRFAANRPRPVSSPLAFGEGGAKSRIRHALSYKRPAFRVIAAAAILSLAAALLLLADPKGEDTEPLGTYVFGEVLYTNPLSSYYPVGTTGYAYQLAGDAFLIRSQETGETAEAFSPVNWDGGTAVTAEEWRGMFDGSFALYPPPDLPRDATMVEVSGEYRVVLAGDQVWLATMGGREGHIWSVYRLVPAGTAVEHPTAPAALDADATADARQRIDALLETIASSPATASGPGSYIEAHPAEYQELLSLGNEALHYLFSAFLRGGQTDLKAHIMGAALRELAGESYASPEAGTPQEEFDRWKAHILALGENESLDYFERNDPPAYLLLTMLEAGEAAAGGSPLAARYYDYFAANGQVAYLLGDELEGPGFSDEEISYYVLSRLIGETPDYQQLTGFPMANFDAVAMEHFGRTVERYENRAATLLESGNITPTGWGGNSVALVLKELEGEADGRIRALFYQFSFGMGEALPPPEELRERLLTGKSEEFGPCVLVRMEFTEQMGPAGDLSLLYHDVEPLGEAEPPYLPAE